MPFRQANYPNKIPLPIAGHTFTHFGDTSALALFFKSPDGLQSFLSFHHEIILTHPDSSTSNITSSMPGLTWDLDTSHAMLSFLLAKVVASAYARKDGRLELKFDDGTLLQVNPDNYEAWHFQQPAPGIRPPYHKDHFSLIGYGRGLIGSGAA